MPLSASAEGFAERVPALRRRFEQRLQAETAPRLPDGKLGEALRYALGSPGKRLRPLLCYATAETLGLPHARVDLPALALELVHTYSLAHDDLPAMDDDDLRRGRPSLHCAFDEATAILVGDGLLTLAFELLASADAPAQVRLAWVRELAVAAGPLGMVQGQALDLAGQGRPPDMAGRGKALDSARQGSVPDSAGQGAALDLAGRGKAPNSAGRDKVPNSAGQGGALDLAALTELHSRKTGRMVTLAIRMAACLQPELSAADLQRLSAFGDLIGLAFQIRDDILNVTASTETLGKPQGSDQRQAKATFVSLLGLEGAQAKLNELLGEAESTLASLNHDTGPLLYMARQIAHRDA